MSDFLAATLPLMTGETPSGHVSRLAKLHDTTPRDFCSDLGMHWPSLCSGRWDQLERLAWLTGHDVEQLKLWAATPITPKQYQVGKATAPTRVFRRTACRCCPLCVYEGRKQHGAHGIFELLEWKVLSLHRCQTHGVQFMTLPLAPHSHEAYDFSTQALLHWNKIEKAACAAVNLPWTSFEQSVRARLRGHAQEDWLAGLDLANMQGASLHLGAALDGIGSQRIGRLEDAQIHKLCERGYSYLRQGPSGLNLALCKLDASDHGERSYFSADIGAFYHWLNGCADDITLTALVETTRTHIFTSYPVSKDKLILGEKPTQEIWLTMEEARKRSGFGAAFLKKLLGHMQGLSEQDALRRTRVRVTELTKVQEFWRKLLNLSQAAQMLSLRPDQIKAMMRLGLLTQIRITSTLRYSVRDEVDALLKQIEALPLQAKTTEFQPIGVFCRDKKIPLMQVLRAFMCKDPQWHFRRRNGSGFSAIEVTTDTVKQELVPSLDQDLSLSQAARYLQISLSSVRKLRDAGYLCSVKKVNPDTKHIKEFLLRQSIETFEKNYTTLGQMASHRNIAPIHLARKLDRGPLFPISCGDTLVRAYDRGAAIAEGIIEDAQI